MERPRPLQELIVYFRKYERLPDEWAGRFSTTGDLREAVAAAWRSEPDACAMLDLAVHWADSKALSLVAVGFGRMLFKYLPKKNQVARKALEFLETWATKPGAAAPRLGWRALADSVDPEEDKDDLATGALSTIGIALTIPDHPCSIRHVAEGVLSSKTGELVEATGRDSFAIGELEIDELDGAAQEEMLGPMADIVRQFIPAPAAETFMRALNLMRSKGLSEALEKKSAWLLQAYKPD